MPPLLQDQTTAESYLWAIILVPLGAALVNGLFGRRMRRGNVALVAIAAVGIAFVLSAIAFAWAASSPPRALHFRGVPWIHVAGPQGRPMVSVGWGLLVDRLSATLLLVVTGVGFLIHVYSAAYMSHEDDGGFARYFTYLNLFVAAMLTLVLGDSLLVTFVGWEGVGLCSYLLIGFWYTDAEKAWCGRKAFVVNRIGDFGFLLGIFAVLSVFGTASYTSLASLSGGLDPQAVVANGAFAGRTLGFAVTFATLGLFLGCIGKSAQIPLYVWLPDAMAGPTPVSALIHAATMVTAGVYLVARTSFLFALAPISMAVVTLTGAATALVAAAIAFAQTDIKKVLAYSTVSQLGFMFIGAGAGVFFAGILHLVTHAFFKACLFLGAGSVMHGMADDTDITNMGGLWRRMPSTAFTFLVATLAITGIAPLSGFFSKDAILAGALSSHNPAAPWVGPTAYVLGTMAAAGTAFYMVRLFALTFAGEPRSPRAAQAHESSPVMTVPLWILAALSAVALVLGLPRLESLGPWGEAFADFVAPVFRPAVAILRRGAAAAPEHGLALWPFFVAWGVAIAAGLAASAMYAGWPRDLRALPDRLARAFPAAYSFARDKFRADELYDFVVVRSIRGLAEILARAVDGFAIERLAVNGVPRAVGFAGRALRVLQNGDVQRYAAVMAAAAAVILWVALGPGGR